MKALAVIHVTSGTQALKNAEIAARAGMDGVFLISHGDVEDSELIDISHLVCEATYVDDTEMWVGINRLSFEASDAFDELNRTRGSHAVKGIWVDNSDDVDVVQERRAKSGWTGLYFGGVAFKYQLPVANEDLGIAARTAADNGVDVVTTSGPATGEPASIDKIKIMKAALGDHPLAVASGITPENVAEFMPYLDYALVATGISKNFHTLDLERATELMRVINGIL